MPTRLRLLVERVESRWRWSLLDVYGGECARGYEKTEDTARAAAARMAGLLWPGAKLEA